MLEVEKPADMKAHVGQQIGTSEWVLVDQAMIDMFAEATATTSGSMSTSSGRSARCRAARRSPTAI